MTVLHFLKFCFLKIMIRIFFNKAMISKTCFSNFYFFISRILFHGIALQQTAHNTHVISLKSNTHPFSRVQYIYMYFISIKSVAWNKSAQRIFLRFKKKISSYSENPNNWAQTFIYFLNFYAPGRCLFRFQIDQGSSNSFFVSEVKGLHVSNKTVSKAYKTDIHLIIIVVHKRFFLVQDTWCRPCFFLTLCCSFRYNVQITTLEKIYRAIPRYGHYAISPISVV